jgi:transposase
VLDHDTRSAVLRLVREGHGSRAIAKALGISRKSVQRVLRSGQAEVPVIERPDQLSEHAERIRALHLCCGGNLVRVHEELQARHALEVPYSTLTRFCREAKIGVEPKLAAGRYDFAPGREMQHDTSPHRVEVGGHLLALQCASLVMCFSRRRFVQCYRRWTRFHAKVFLTRALCFFEGAAEACMLDNSTVIMTGGTGPDAQPVPEMKAFADRFGFTFLAHNVGDANRSARVEGPFWHVENNFYPGRTFADLADLNAQAIDWCRTYNRTFHKSFGGIPDELGVLERQAGKPLPLFVPEPTEIHPRRADTEGFVRLHTNRYSVPEDLIGQELEVHETIERVRVFFRRRIVAEHDRREDGANDRVLLPEHRGRRGRWAKNKPPSPEELALRAAGPALAALCDQLRKDPRRGRKAVLRLHRIWRDYPTEAVEHAVARALDFGLADLARIEEMVLKNLHGTFFKLPSDPEDDHGR